MSRPAENGETLWIAGYPVQCPTPAALTARLLDALERGEKTALLFANANFAVQCTALRARLREAGIVIVNDGLGMDIAARFFHRRRLRHNLNGTDFVPALLARARRPVFLFGARPGIAARAAAALRVARLPVAGSCDGYAGRGDAARLVATINASGADIVLVALGNPLQEEWILAHRAALAAPLVIGVGALFDFVAGQVPRAPPLVRRLRLEWLYRLAHEPRRLARRYTVDIVRFLALCAARGGPGLDAAGHGRRGADVSGRP